MNSTQGGNEMIYVVKDDKILNRCDAWEFGGEQRMKDWARKNGFTVTDARITLMGDMVITVK